jgi:hypothetical protein
MKDDEKHNIGSPKHGAYGFGVRSQVIEVIVRQALAGAEWQKICAKPMQVNNITVEEIEAEVRMRRSRAPARSFIETIIQQLFSIFPWMRKDSGDSKPAEVSPSVPPPENVDEEGYVKPPRAQIFDVIVRQALAGVPWREICAGPMQVNNITPEEVDEEVQKRRGGRGTSAAAVPKKPKPSQGEGEISLPLPPPENEDET